GPAGDLVTGGFEDFGERLVDALASGCLIDLEKTVDQEVVIPGTTVQYTYVVSNPMTVNLTNIRLSDNKCSAISSRTVISGDGDSTLEPSEVWQYTCSQAINANTTNTAVVTGTIASIGTDVTDTDTATVTTLEPGAGSLAAFKFHDYDMDGKWDGGEPAIEDWQLCLDGDDCKPTDGYGFAVWNGVSDGAHTVSETVPAGWAASTATSHNVNLSLGKYTLGAPGPTSATLSVPNTTDSYGITFLGRSGNTWTYKVEEISGRNLSHWVLGLGTCDGLVVSTSPTATSIGHDDSTGFFGAKWEPGEAFTSGEFSITLNGNYPTGTIQALVKTGKGGSGSGIALGTIAGPVCTTFGNYRTDYTLSGAKYLDQDGDGVWDAVEDGLAGWEIRLEDSAGTAITTTTGADGAYTFDNLIAGTYTVTEVLQDGWEQTAPASGKHVVTLSPDRGDVTGVDFGNRGALSIAGVKYHDLDGDGVKDAGEPGLAGWTIQLKDSAGAVIATATTDANGAYSFDHLVPGSYTVAEVQQAGWRQTAPAAGVHSVTLTDADATGIDFGNQQLGGLTITKTVVGGTGTFNICITGPSPATTESCKSTSGGSVSWPG
ncbi:MAG: hypothetical protein GX591_08610, partial [Planctomycetes bacterium]|nr:hypothetical protein [Planctomycetota bacterium]